MKEPLIWTDFAPDDEGNAVAQAGIYSVVPFRDEWGNTTGYYIAWPQAGAGASGMMEWGDFETIELAKAEAEKLHDDTDTSELWHLNRNFIQIRNPNGTHHTIGFFHGHGDEIKSDEARASRAVACVNALAGIPTHLIESGYIADLIRERENQVVTTLKVDVS